MQGPSDEYRSGGRRTIDDERVEKVIAKALRSCPPTVPRAGRPAPWPRRWCCPADDQPHLAGVRAPASLRGLQDLHKPHLLDKIHNVVALYLNQRAVVLCIDEKTGIQALERTQPVLPVLRKLTGAGQPRLCARRHR